MTKGSLVFREGLEIVAVAVVFIVCLGLGEGKNNNACNADFGTGPPSFSQAGQPWEPLIAWHIRAGPLSQGPGAGLPAFSKKACLGWKESFLLSGNRRNTHKHPQTLALTCVPGLDPLWPHAMRSLRGDTDELVAQCCPTADLAEAIFRFLFCSSAPDWYHWHLFSISQGWNVTTNRIGLKADFHKNIHYWCSLE